MSIEQKKKAREIAADPDYEYFNTTITHDSTFGNARSPASITITRSAPIINFMENFYVTISRMTFPALTIPLFVAPLVVGSNYSENKMIYSINLDYYTGSVQYTSGQVYVTFTPSVLTAQPGTGVVQTSLQSLNPYYYCYTIKRLCDMFNNAFNTAYENLQTASGGQLPPESHPPFLYWSLELQTLILKVDEQYYKTGNLSKFEIFFNNETAPFFNGFEFTSLASNTATGKDNQLYISYSPDYVATPDDGYYYVKPFAYDASYFSSVASFQVTTSLPVNYESVQPINYNYGQSSTANNAPQNPNPSSNLLTDFIPDMTDAINFNAVFDYNKTDSTRYAAFVSNGPVQNFSLALSWTDIAGNQIPLYLNPGMTATIKIAFLKKSILNTEGELLLLQKDK